MRHRLIAFFLFAGLSTPLMAQERHPMMDSDWWVTAGSYFSDRDFKASASGSIGGITREFDLEGALGLDDSPALFMGELGWQFVDKWGVALQYFRSSRGGSRVLTPWWRPSRRDSRAKAVTPPCFGVADGIPITSVWSRLHGRRSHHLCFEDVIHLLACHILILTLFV